MINSQNYRASIVGIGSTIWVFDQNHRIYAKDEKGRSHGSPIWREYWRPRKIMSETKQSWLLEGDQKLSKKDMREGKLNGVAFSQEQINEMAYVQDNRHLIREKLNYINDYAIMKQVADIIGYKEEEKKK